MWKGQSAMRDNRRQRASTLATILLGVMAVVITLGLMMASPARAQTTTTSTTHLEETTTTHPAETTTTHPEETTTTHPEETTTTAHAAEATQTTSYPIASTTTTTTPFIQPNRATTTVAPAPTTTVAKHGGLAFTGADITMTVGGAAIALGAGGVLLLVSRKRKADR